MREEAQVEFYRAPEVASFHQQIVVTGTSTVSRSPGGSGGSGRQPPLAFEGFLIEDASPDQIKFIQLIIQYLPRNGVMGPGAIYESPFTDRAPAGPEAVFGASRVVELASIVRKVGSVDEGASASNG